jgi:hypothetical protein
VMGPPPREPALEPAPRARPAGRGGGTPAPAGRLFFWLDGAVRGIITADSHRRIDPSLLEPRDAELHTDRERESTGR